MAMALAATAAAAAAAGKQVFDYNRENFMEDRDQRMNKEFAERRYRVMQASLWREDSRDFVSLTERKMSIYLLVNVLLLSFNVNLWTEGRLPEHAPPWLTMGMQLAIADSFLFLLLTVWLAMHGAVAAQSYQTRVLTQIIRLPIPSWQELEACRTYGSDFERVEPRQMFRVPFLGSKQEAVARSSAPPACAAELHQPRGDEPSEEGGSPESPDVICPGAGTALTEEVAADPWGLEQRGDDTYELGCAFGEKVAKLRHIKLMRQAAVYWQTYDAFARVSMSVGVNQLLLAMCYYVIGYLLGQVGAPMSALAAVSVLVAAALLLAQVDLTLSPWELRLFRSCVALGPTLAFLAAERWSQQYSRAIRISECLAPLAFISHGVVVGLMTLLVKVRVQENGAMLPLAFQGVLFLDVFGWVRHKNRRPEANGPQAPSADGPAVVGAEAAGRSTPGHPARNFATWGSFREDGEAMTMQRSVSDSIASGAWEEEPATIGGTSNAWDTVRPATACIAYDDLGRPLPSRPVGAKPPGCVDDMRYTEGAPRMWDTVNAVEPPGKEFWDPVTFMPPEDRRRRKMDDLLRDGGGDEQVCTPGAFLCRQDDSEVPMETGHDNEAPGLVPWRTFYFASQITSLVWVFAGCYYLLHAVHPLYVVAASAWQVPRMYQVTGTAPMPRPEAMVLANASVLLQQSAQRVPVTWPYPSISPRTLACDASGQHAVATDGLSVFVAELNRGSRSVEADAVGTLGLAGETPALARRSLRQGRAPQAVPRVNFIPAVVCRPLRGEALQDAALLCLDGGACLVLALHRHGRQVSGCPLQLVGAGTVGQETANQSFSAPVCHSWLRARTGAVGSRGAERLAWLILDDDCAKRSTTAGAALQGGCVSVATTHGRVAQLHLNTADGKLVPTEVWEEADAAVLGAPRGMDFNSKSGIAYSLRERPRSEGADADGAQAQASAAPGTSCRVADSLLLLGAGPAPALWRLPVPAAQRGGT